MYDVLLLMEDAKGDVAGLYGFRYYVNQEKQKLDKVDIIGPDQSFGCELGNSQPIVLPKDASKAKEVKAQDLINSMLKGMDVEM